MGMPGFPGMNGIPVSIYYISDHKIYNEIEIFLFADLELSNIKAEIILNL